MCAIKTHKNMYTVQNPGSDHYSPEIPMKWIKLQNTAVINMEVFFHIKSNAHGLITISGRDVRMPTNVSKLYMQSLLSIVLPIQSKNDHYL